MAVKLTLIVEEAVDEALEDLVGKGLQLSLDLC